MVTPTSATDHSGARTPRRSPVTDTGRGATENDPTTDFRNKWSGTVNEAQTRRIRFGLKPEKTPFTDHRRPGVLVHPRPIPRPSTRKSPADPPRAPWLDCSGNPTTRTKGVHRTRHPTSRPIPDINGRCYRPITTFRPGHWPIGTSNRVPNVRSWSANDRPKRRFRRIRPAQRHPENPDQHMTDPDQHENDAENPTREVRTDGGEVVTDPGQHAHQTPQPHGPETPARDGWSVPRHPHQPCPTNREYQQPDQQLTDQSRRAVH